MASRYTNTCYNSVAGKRRSHQFPRLEKNHNRKGNQMKQRSTYLDLVKAIAMILVVVCHVMMSCYSDFGNTNLFNIVWIAQIPLFMVVSGMLAPSGKKVQDAKSLLFQLAKKTAIYLIPCLSFSILNALSSNSNWFIVLGNSIKDPQTNLWFLWVLFLFVFLFTIGQYIANKIKSHPLKIVTPPYLS